MKFVRKFLYGLVILGILVFSDAALAAEFSADMISSQFGQQTKGKIFIKGDKMRFEATPSGGQTAVTIMDLRSGRVISLMPQEKMYIEMSGTAAQTQLDQFDVDKEIAKLADKKFLGTEKVNGYACDKYEFVYHDASMGTLVQWYSKKLGYPIKTIYRSSHGVVTTEYKNIREGGVSDSLFQVPPGYQKMNMPAMSSGFGQGIGGMG